MVEQPKVSQEELEISALGPRNVKSPLRRTAEMDVGLCSFVPDDMRVLYEPRFRLGEKVSDVSFERAGARQEIFFQPEQTTAAIVSCGGLCPGINNVIRSLVLEMTYNYGVKRILGIRYGYRGMGPQAVEPPWEMTPDVVEHIHHQGGSILASSRGHQEPTDTVDYLVANNIDILFCIGGDGTQRGAHKIAQEVGRRQLPIAVVGIPKTIDNDIKYCYRTFGYYTAVAEAERVIDCAHTEAKGALNGVGLVKLMGREAGFIAAAATVASGEANFTLIPEQPLELEGPRGFLCALKRRLEARRHAVVVVAEGAGQHLLTDANDQRDESGNRRFGDVGLYLKQQITEFGQRENFPIDVK